MKHILHFIILLIATLACTTQKGIPTKQIDDSTIKNKIIPVNKQKFSPGTIALDIKITQINSTNGLYLITACINKLLGSGAGISQHYSKGQKITFKTKLDLQLLKDNNYSLLFREMPSMGNNESKLSLIKKIK